MIRLPSSPNSFSTSNSKTKLLEGDIPGRVGGANAGPTVPGGLVGDAVLAEEGADHLSLDFNTKELLAVVNTNDVADHLRPDGQIPAVGLDRGGLGTSFVGHVLLGLAVDDGVVLSGDASAEGPPVAAVEHLEQLFS